MEWPDIDYETFEFLTTNTEKQVWRRAADAALADFTQDHSVVAPKVAAFKERLATCENWAQDYRSIVEDFVTIMASVDNETALDMAQAGIDSLHDLLLFRIDTNTIVPAKDVFVLTGSFPKLPTKTLVGSKAPDIDFQFGLANPKNPQDILYGLDACAQVNAWHKYGVMETSASVLAKTTFTHSNLPGTMGNKRFVLLGCTSELGPAKSLLLIPGITILGIARGGKKLDDLLDYARFNAPDDTTFLYNPKGADIMSEGPQIAQWILDQTSPENELVIIPLAQLEGEADVRVTVAMDLIIQRIFRQREKSILCVYMSPTSVMVLPPTASSTATRRLEERPTWEKWTNALTMGRWLQPSMPTCNNDYTILNGLVTAQGSHYALAKMVQMWRCMIAYYRDAHIVAAPFAPLTRTSSMISNSTMASALEGMHHFEPMLAFDVEPGSTLMASVLVSQIQFMNRPLPDMEENPFTMFWDGAVQYVLEVVDLLGRCAHTSNCVISPISALCSTYSQRGCLDVSLQHGIHINAQLGHGEIRVLSPGIHPGSSLGKTKGRKGRRTGEGHRGSLQRNGGT